MHVQITKSLFDKNILLPSHTGENLTLRWSLNNGESWKNKTVQIWPGPSCYSCITSMDTGFIQDKKYIYVIYEKGQKNCDETISFVKIRLYAGH